MSSQFINQQLAKARVAIDNALTHPEINLQLSRVGYNTKKIMEGKHLQEEALRLQEAYEEKCGDQYGATDTFYEDLEQIKTRYSRHRKLAKVAFENNRKLLKMLQLNNPLPRRVEDWLLHVNTFYSVLMAHSEVIELYGILTEDLAQAQAMAEALLDARNRQISAKGEAQHATRQRNSALDALKAWMKEFHQGARFALRDDEQLLEVLGIMVAASR